MTDLETADTAEAERANAKTRDVSDKPAYPSPASLPTQEGPYGIRYDFNQGCRVLMPPHPTGHPWHVRLRDLSTGNILFDTNLQEGFINSSKRWFVRFRIEVRDGETTVLQHDYNARDRPVLIQFPIGTLGDTIAWLSYAVRFGEVHGCKLTLAMSGLIIPLFENAYPHIEFVTHEGVDVSRFYATYSLGLFFDDKENVWQPTDFRMVGLHRTAAYILGVDPAEAPPRMSHGDESRPMQEPYICIGVQSSSQCKYWNNALGWHAVVARLKERGYRVVCIDQKPVHGHGLVWNHIPHGVEDETGDRPLIERARWLRHAAGFIGLSSGLSWLAWAAGTKVLLISGFTHPINEFSTPFRVNNWHACNSCWNDPTQRFDHKDFLWCPRHAGTSRQFECTRLITAEHVLAFVDRMLS
jgi:autotransporter strand-loop-strand O-heptosyltransferase